MVAEHQGNGKSGVKAELWEEARRLRDEDREAGREKEEYRFPEPGTTAHLEAWRKGEEDKRTEPEPSQPAQEEPRFSVLDTAQFFRAEYPLQWLVQGFLVAKQPMIVCGPSKCLKTSLLIDLAISLGSGTAFLDRFKVYRPVRVLLLSGESGPSTIQETARLVSQAKGLRPEDISVSWGFELPHFGNAFHMLKLQGTLKRGRFDVVIMDPLYLCLLAGTSLSAANMFQMGPALQYAADTCLGLGATPILAHHTTKHVGRAHEPLELDDMAYAGITEFARQWALVSRREAYDPETGVNKLWLGSGGSAKFSSLWAVDVDEGRRVQDEDSTLLRSQGLKWEVSVCSASEAREQQSDQKAGAVQARKDRTVRERGDKILKALDDLDLLHKDERRPGRFLSASMVAAAAKLSSQNYAVAAAALEAERLVECRPKNHEVQERGTSVKLSWNGIRRCIWAPLPTAQQTLELR